MTATQTITPYRSDQRPGHDGFGHLLLAEWTKFRTVRGWVIGMVAAAALTALATVALASSAQNNNSMSGFVTGPGGRAVVDSFYFVHQPLTGNGSITVRVTSLTGGVAGPPVMGPSNAAQPWAKAGIMIKASTKPGSAYAAMLVTGSHGVRMQYDYFHDVAGLPGSVSSAVPRWLRLTRSGDTITGYDSADGTHWSKVGTATLAGLPATVQAGLFAASPAEIVGRQAFANDSEFPLPAWAIGAFDHVSLLGGGSANAWTGSGVDEGPIVQKVSFHCGSGPCQRARKVATNPGFTRSAGTFTVNGNGDIAPYVPTVDPLEVTFKASLIGLVAMIAIGVLFVTSEYRRGLIRTTFAASPRRGRVLLAKAIVAGSVTFVAGAVAAAVAFPIAESKLRSNGWLASIYPVNSLISGTGLRVVLGTAALLAIGTIFALAVGSVLRRSAGAISAGIVLLVFPLILATVLPQAPADWLLRLTPAAAFGVQTTTPRYPQVVSACLPYHGCYPLAPWTGIAVLGAWAAIAMAVAVYLLRTRDA